MKYIIRVTIDVTMSSDEAIEADTQEEAEEIALKRAADGAIAYDFDNGSDVDPRITHVEVVKP